jgi:chlorobactene glucosyltransferase
VSILIPARNEARVIGETLRCLLRQDYPHFEVLLLDDHSTDGTGTIARDLADPRLKVIAGAPLPSGWMGKNWACHQLSTHAQGDYWIFTDADVRWGPGGLSAVMAAVRRHQTDLLTVWPTQQTITWAERLIVPLMALAIIGYLPVIGTHYTPFSVFAAACGQCMIWRRGAYQQIGGHQAVRSTVLEDVTLARLVKAAGLRLRMFDGAGVIACRMYENWSAVRDGYAKNILAGYGNSIPVLLLATVFHLLIFIFPPIWWLFGGGVLAFALTVLGITIRMLTAAFTRQRVIDGLAMPLSAALMTVIAFQSIYWQLRFGGPTWKGRIIKQG